MLGSIAWRAAALLPAGGAPCGRRWTTGCHTARLLAGGGGPWPVGVGVDTPPLQYATAAAAAAAAAVATAAAAR